MTKRRACLMASRRSSIRRAGDISDEKRPLWKRPFEEPIILPDGRALVTLLDAANYVTALPRKEAESAEWQAAIAALILVADSRTGPTMLARIGVMKALAARSA
ncbi:hypothetical protein [Bradyrhizobium sp. USDA 4473]